MTYYNKEDVYGLARMALADCDNNTAKAAVVVRSMFPILGLRGAVDVVRNARVKEPQS